MKIHRVQFYTLLYLNGLALEDRGQGLISNLKNLLWQNYKLSPLSPFTVSSVIFFRGRGWVFENAVRIGWLDLLVPRRKSECTALLLSFKVDLFDHININLSHLALYSHNNNILNPGKGKWVRQLSVFSTCNQSSYSHNNCLMYNGRKII